MGMCCSHLRVPAAHTLLVLGGSQSTKSLVGRHEHSRWQVHAEMFAWHRGGEHCHSSAIWGSLEVISGACVALCSN
jgi:hypothetical protein